MKKLQLLLICLTLLHTVHAQDCPDIQDNTTNPDAPNDYRGNDPGQNLYINLKDDGSGEPKLDWREDRLDWEHPGVGGGPSFNCEIENPYFAEENKQNIDFLYDQLPENRDYHPEDGWELLIQDLGLNMNGSISSISHPYIVLYNKFTGIVRVFYYLREPNFEQDYDAVTIKLSFKDETNNFRYESSNFNHKTEVARPIDKHLKDQNEQMPNYLNAGLAEEYDCIGMWIHADFVMAYDPCVCNFAYKRMRIEVMATDIATIELTGDLTTKPITKDANGSAVDHTSPYKTGFKEVQGAGKEAKTYFENGKK